MNQHDFVLGCQRYYAENHYEPGNPEDGTWEDCHYPVPKCLGGTATVKLLKEHHAIQGVLQSEEYQTCCVAGWEKAILVGTEYYELWKKWLTKMARDTKRRQREEGTLSELCSAAGLVGGRVSADLGYLTLGHPNCIKTFESLSKAGKKGSSVTNSQRWQCLTTGYVSTSAGAVRYQRLRGIDSSKENRKRVDG
jgi:hypothetical protein